MKKINAVNKNFLYFMPEIEAKKEQIYTYFLKVSVDLVDI